MADIELVIKIPEKDYEIMKHNIAVNNPLCPLSQKEMVSKIAKGIPLPKEHGKLIDAESAKLIVKPITQADSECAVTMETAKKLIFDAFDKAPTIIEADEEEEE